MFARRYIKQGLVLAEIPSMAFSDSNQLDDPKSSNARAADLYGSSSNDLLCRLHPRDLNSRFCGYTANEGELEYRRAVEFDLFHGHVS